MTTFDINADAVMDLAAQKLANEIGSQISISEKVDRIISGRIDEAMKTIVNTKIDQIIDAQLERMMNQTIQPVDIWGNKTGEPTTIANALSERAKEFWNTKVDGNGKVIARDSYNHREAKTRAEYMMGKMISEEFAALVRNNAVEILVALKEKLREDAHASVTKHLDELIRVRTR